MIDENAVATIVAKAFVAKANKPALLRVSSAHAALVKVSLLRAATLDYSAKAMESWHACQDVAAISLANKGMRLKAGQEIARIKALTEQALEKDMPDLLEDIPSIDLGVSRSIKVNLVCIGLGKAKVDKVEAGLRRRLGGILAREVSQLDKIPKPSDFVALLEKIISQDNAKNGGQDKAQDSSSGRIILLMGSHTVSEKRKDESIQHILRLVSQAPLSLISRTLPVAPGHFTPVARFAGALGSAWVLAPSRSVLGTAPHALDLIIRRLSSGLGLDKAAIAGMASGGLLSKQKGASGLRALVLAAGRSRRLGRDKRLVELDGEPLLWRTVRILRESQLFEQIHVVLSQNDEEIAKNIATEGVAISMVERSMLSHSLVRGLQAMGASYRAAAILPADLTRLEVAHLHDLLAFYQSNPKLPARPRDKDSAPGHPLIIPRALVASFIARCLERPSEKPVDALGELRFFDTAISGYFQDLDTLADLAKIKGQT